MYFVANQSVIDAIAGTVINPQLRDTSADRIVIPEVASRDSINSLKNNSLSFRVKGIEPFRKWLPSIVGLTD
jgi:hypothetical protein